MVDRATSSKPMSRSRSGGLLTISPPQVVHCGSVIIRQVVLGPDTMLSRSARRLDPGILAVIVCCDVGGVPRVGFALQCFILPAFRLMASQVRAERQVPFDVAIVCLIDMHIVRADLAAILGEEPAAGQAILAPGMIPGLCHRMSAFVDERDISNQRQQIDDRLGR